MPDPLDLLPPGRQGLHYGATPVPRRRGSDLRCSSLAAAGAGPAASPQSAADLGLSRPGDRALGEHGPAGLGSLARPRLLAGAWALQRLQPRKQKSADADGTSLVSAIKVLLSRPRPQHQPNNQQHAAGAHQRKNPIGVGSPRHPPSLPPPDTPRRRG